MPVKTPEHIKKKMQRIEPHVEMGAKGFVVILSRGVSLPGYYLNELAAFRALERYLGIAAEKKAANGRA